MYVHMYMGVLNFFSLNLSFHFIATKERFYTFFVDRRRYTYIHKTNLNKSYSKRLSLHTSLLDAMVFMSDAPVTFLSISACDLDRVEMTTFSMFTPGRPPMLREFDLQRNSLKRLTMHVCRFF